ncbi:MAG TPA: benzoate-CoA ligase family protein [Rhizobiales bacterium]|nr:benzoate-CoA ligase family protein [Hyphomicrobiales bacterium]
MEFDRTYNAARDLVDRNVEEGRGAKLAYIDPERTLTFDGLASQTRRMANALEALGIRREERIAVLMLDTVDWPVVFFGAIRAGIVPVALNTLLTTAQYEYMLNDSRARALFVSVELYPVVKDCIAASPFLEHVVIAGGDAGGHARLDSLLEEADSTYETVATCADETAFWLYSSGSTGNPKGTLHVQTSMAYTARTYGQNVLGIREDDICYSAAKFFFAYGLGNSISFPLSVGATTVLLPTRPTPADVFKTLKTYQPTLFFGVPTLFAAILADRGCTPENGSQALRLCASAGEALPRDVGEHWRKRYGVDIIDGVGSTEMLHIFLSNRPGDVRYGTSGKPFDGYDLRLVDDKGADVPTGEIGELLVNGSSSASGYWNQREKTRKTFEGEWTHTGDKYTLDEEGYYHYCGRTDDMFKVSGIWVSPFDVEQALISHPAVLEAAVVAHEDDDALIKPKAFVILVEGASSDGLYEELKEHVKSSIGKWKYPRWIEFVDDLPKTATGKIQRFKLRS